MNKNNAILSQSRQLIALDYYFDEMVKLYKSKKFPKVLLLNGQKGIGKFTLVLHFLNYIFSTKEKTNYNTNNKIININSKFYNSIINQTSQEIILLQAQEDKNIKINDIRNLKSSLFSSSLSDGPRFTIIDEVEFLNTNSANALLKTLEEPSDNNYFILINNQQSNLLETISSRCLKNNIFLNTAQKKSIIDFLIQDQKIEILIDKNEYMSPGQFIIFNDHFKKYKIFSSDDIKIKLQKLLYGYKKDKNKTLISLSFFLIDQFFYKLIIENENRIEFLLDIKFSLINRINDFIQYNLNINSVLNGIELKINNV
jgi:DNA polymerase-3 subunit delta'